MYVGNLNLLSTEAEVHKLFSEAGKIKTIIMGLDKQTLGPGGFCFVEYVHIIINTYWDFFII